MSTAEQGTRAVVERFYAALAGWDEDAVRACLHEDAELHQSPALPFGGVYRGADAMMPLWKDVVLRLADPESFRMEGFYVDGEVAVVVASAKAVIEGEAVLSCEEYTVRDGRIARIRVFWFDPAPVAAAAGALAG